MAHTSLRVARGDPGNGDARVGSTLRRIPGALLGAGKRRPSGGVIRWHGHRSLSTNLGVSQYSLNRGAGELRPEFPPGDLRAAVVTAHSAVRGWSGGVPVITRADRAALVLAPGPPHVRRPPLGRGNRAEAASGSRGTAASQELAGGQVWVKGAWGQGRLDNHVLRFQIPACARPRRRREYLTRSRFRQIVGRVGQRARRPI